MVHSVLVQSADDTRVVCFSECFCDSPPRHAVLASRVWEHVSHSATCASTVGALCGEERRCYTQAGLSTAVMQTAFPSPQQAATRVFPCPALAHSYSASVGEAGTASLSLQSSTANSGGATSKNAHKAGKGKGKGSGGAGASGAGGGAPPLELGMHEQVDEGTFHVESELFGDADGPDCLCLWRVVGQCVISLFLEAGESALMGMEALGLLASGLDEIFQRGAGSRKGGSQQGSASSSKGNSQPVSAAAWTSSPCQTLIQSPKDLLQKPELVSALVQELFPAGQLLAVHPVMLQAIAGNAVRPHDLS